MQWKVTQNDTIYKIILTDENTWVLERNEHGDITTEHYSNKDFKYLVKDIQYFQKNSDEIGFNMWDDILADIKATKKAHNA